MKDTHNGLTQEPWYAANCVPMSNCVVTIPSSQKMGFAEGSYDVYRCREMESRFRCRGIGTNIQLPGARTSLQILSAILP